MEYVYVKDSGGYVFKKLESEVSPDEKIISEKEYLKKSGLASYAKEFGYGGVRKNAGRKQKFASPLKFQIRVTQEEKDFITFARKKIELFHTNAEVISHNTRFNLTLRTSRKCRLSECYMDCSLSCEAAVRYGDIPLK